MLQLTDIGLRRGTNLLFEGAQVTIRSGRKVGVVGPNGCSKSSLFSLIRGELHPDRGELSVPASWEIAHVAQQTPSGERPAIDLVLDGDRKLRSVQTQLASAEGQGDSLRQAQLHEHLEAIDAIAPRAAPLACCMGSASPPARNTGRWTATRAVGACA